MKYNLVILGYSSEYLPIFTELEPQVLEQISPFWKNERDLLRFLLRIDLDLNHSVDILPKISEQPTCYLFFREWYPLFAAGCLKKVKKKFPHIKACWFFSDLVSSYPTVNIEQMKSEFDLILSFDPEDAKHYDFIYCPLPYSMMPLEKRAVTKDLFFIGQPKGRLDQIFSIYQKFRKAGLHCDFHIANAPPALQRFKNEIDYCSFLPYAQCLQMGLSSRCILELLQEPNHHGYTARTAEALVYGRKLLSNNTRLKEAPFYNPQQIHIFSEPEQIDLNFVTETWQPVCLPAPFSPLRTVELIEKQLNIRFSL